MFCAAAKTRGGQQAAFLTIRTVFLAGASLGLAVLLGSCPTASGQAAKATPDASKPNAKKADAPLGNYSLVTTVFEPSPTTHLLNPPLTIAVDGGTERAPGEFTGDKSVPAQYTIESFGISRYDCVATVAKLHGCDALDRADLTIRDQNTIAWHVVSRGAAVALSVNVEVHDVLPVSHGSPNMEWHAHEVIFVAVSKATPTYRFSSEVLVGEWAGEAVVFEVGKDLPDSAKKALEDLGIKQDLGDHILYSFRVKEK